MNKIKKLAFGVLTSAMLLGGFAGVTFAKVATVPGPWQLIAPTNISFVCNGKVYNHTLKTVSGNFSGTGFYNVNPKYTWIINGSIAGDNISFAVVYTGLSAGTTYNGVGNIASNGSIKGTVDNNCQTFSMRVGSAIRFTGNHGQYVKSQEDKKDAAKSRVGMPVQSNGHKK